MVSSPAWAETPDAPVRAAPRVHIETTDADAILFKVPTVDERAQLGDTYRDWGVPICRAPCDRIVNRPDGSRFFVGSSQKDVPASPRFELGPRSGDVTLRVSPGSRDRRNHGIGLTVAGGLTMGAGLITALCFGLQSDGIWYANPPPNVGAISGGVAVGVGAGMLIGGIALIVSNKTTVDLLPETGGKGGSSARLDGMTLRF